MKIHLGEIRGKIFVPKTLKLMEHLETQSITSSSSNLFMKVVILVITGLAALCIGSLLYFSCIRGGDKTMNIIAGLFTVIISVVWTMWPSKSWHDEQRKLYEQRCAEGKGPFSHLRSEDERDF